MLEIFMFWSGILRRQIIIWPEIPWNENVDLPCNKPANTNLFLVNGSEGFFLVLLWKFWVIHDIQVKLWTRSCCISLTRDELVREIGRTHTELCSKSFNAIILAHSDTCFHYSVSDFEPNNFVGENAKERT